jgi:hypothetical protein
MTKNKDERPNTYEKRFNETLKRMLKTPPKPHDKAKKDESEEKPKREDER